MLKQLLHGQSISFTHSTPEGRLMIRRFFDTRRASAPLVARLALAALLFPHGAQHALGWFGGYGFTGTLGFPAPLAALAIAIELIAPIALVFGFGGRAAALGLTGLMIGAITTHLPNGFFMNWFGALPTGQEGFEYHLVVIALTAVTAIEGSGAFSVDARIATALARRAGRSVSAPVP